jgi:hypothetical protein
MPSDGSLSETPVSLSNSGRFLLTCCALVSTSLASHGVSWGQEKPLASQEGNLKFAHDFLRAAYPDRVGDGDMLDLCVGQHMDAPWPHNYEVNFEIRRFDPERLSHRMNDPKTGQRLSVPENPTLLEGSFQFDDGGQLDSVWTNTLENQRYQSIRDAVQSHREWSEADAGKALKDAGARYGPDQKEAFIQSIQLARLDRLLGHLKVVSVEFDAFSNSDHLGDFPLLFWIVKADAQLPDGSSRTYSFLFEPFEGTLVSVKHLR